ncbi:MAG: AAA domain-containing protein [Vallitalea sp.]|jgi:superfamily I DNA and/or RNA helicase|nr:AAA domain-containing protein [Vallitalea sp.]
MKYIVDKSVFTSLANNGCKKYAINLLSKKWQESLKQSKCQCGSNKKMIECCGKNKSINEIFHDYNYVEEKLKIKIPHVDKAPLAAHIRQGEYAEIKKIEELSYYYNIGTQLLNIKKSELIKPFSSSGELDITFNKNNSERLGRLIFKRKIKGNDFKIPKVGEICSIELFEKIISNDKYDFLFQFKFNVNKYFFASIIGKIDFESIYTKLPDVEFSNCMPDLIRIVRKNDEKYYNYKVLDANMNSVNSNNDKIKIMVCDIKNSDFSNKFFVELGLYMLALNSYIYDNNLEEMVEVVSEGLIYPELENEIEEERLHRIKNKGKESIAKWRVEFSSIREEIIKVFKEKIPELIHMVEQGKRKDYTEIKITPMCTTCDYYGGQNSAELKKYINNNLGKEHFTYSNIEEYLNDPDNNFCRYCVKNEENINLLPDINTGEKNTLISNSIYKIRDLKKAIQIDNGIFDENISLKSDKKIIDMGLTLREKQENYTLLNKRTINLPKFCNLKIFIDIQKSSKDQTLSFAYSINTIYTDKEGNKINEGGLLNPKLSISLIDEYSFRNDIKEYLEFLFDINDVLINFEDVENKYGQLTYSLIYWGQSTYDHMKKLFLVIFPYLKRDGKGIEEIYISSNDTTIENKKRKIKQLKERFYTLFAPEDELQDYQIVEKSPFFDMKKAVTDTLVMNADISLTLEQVNSLLSNYNYSFGYHKPDSDSFSGYVYGQIWNVDKTGKEKDNFKKDIQKIIEQRLKAMMGIYIHLSKKGYLYGDSPTIIPLKNKNLFGNFDIANDLYLYHKLDNAHELIEKEKIHNEEIYKKKILGKALFLKEEIIGNERSKILEKYDIPNNDEFVVYEIGDESVETKLDKKSLCLTMYPEEKNDFIFKKFVPLKYNNVIYYDDKKYPIDWGYKRNQRTYKKALEVKIHLFKRFNKIIVLRIPSLTKELMKILVNEYNFDFSRNIIIECFHHDFWDSVLKRTLNKLKTNKDKRKMLEDFDLTKINDYSSQNILDAFNEYYDGVDIPLDNSQVGAIIKSLNYNLTLLWGPPGTGKTHTLVNLLVAYNMLNDKPKQVLIMCNTYDAFDNIISKLSENKILDFEDIEIIRLRSNYRASKKYEFNHLNYLDIGSGEYKEKLNELSKKNIKLQIIASTPQQIGKVFGNRPLKSAFNMDLIIVDEASQMDVGHFTPALLKYSKGTQIVLAGDDRQLPPITKVNLENAKENYYGSIFSHYLLMLGDKLRVSLNNNRRSNKTIVNFSKFTFDYDDDYRAVYENRKIGFDKVNKNDDVYSKILNPNNSMVLLHYDDGNANQLNKFEAKEVVNIIRHIWDNGLLDDNNNRYNIQDFLKKGIGVVVPHTAQRRHIQDLLIQLFIDELHLDKDIDKEILADNIISSVDTVERYQGQERDIMICSYVLGDLDVINQEEDFIYSPNRLNVMISRAKAKAIILASNELILNISNNLEIIDAQKSLKELLNYCNDEIHKIGEGEWKNKNGVIRIKK